MLKLKNKIKIPLLIISTGFLVAPLTGGIVGLLKGGIEEFVNSWKFWASDLVIGIFEKNFLPYFLIDLFPYLILALMEIFTSIRQKGKWELSKKYGLITAYLLVVSGHIFIYTIIFLDLYSEDPSSTASLGILAFPPYAAVVGSLGFIFGWFIGYFVKKRYHTE